MRHVLSLLLLLSLALAPALSHAGDQPPPGLPADDFRTPSVMASPADTGFDNSVFAIANYNGDLIVGGAFLKGAGFSYIRVAGWNGISWYPITGFPNGNPVYWLHEHSGLLYAGQALTQLCSWDGASWTGYEPWLGNTFGYILALETYNSELYVGGGFDGNPAQPSYIAKWLGGSWDSVGTGIQGWVSVLHTFGGELIAGGYFTTGQGSVGNRIARWNGATWNSLGSGIGDGVVAALATYNSELIVGGNFTSAGGTTVSNIARWNGSGWQSLGSGFDDWVQALWVYDNKLIAGGRFLNSGSTSASYIASWDGSSWSPIGSGFDNHVYALGEYNGYLIAGGAFSDAGGHVALWDGSVWRPVSDVVTDVKDETTAQRPEGYALDQNYPNPFNPATTIAFEIPTAAHVQISIYNLLGRQLSTLVDERLPAGRKVVTWDGKDDSGQPVASGTYFYRITTDGYVQSRQMLLLK